MSDIHVLGGDGIDQWTLVFHLAVPDQVNAVSVNYRMALVNSGLGGTSVLLEGAGPGQIATAELAQIEAGELYEHSATFPVESGATTNPEMVVAVQAEYAKKESWMINRLKYQLKYYGYAGSAT